MLAAVAVEAIALGGSALHAGGSSAIVLVKRPGPIAFRQRDIEVPLAHLFIKRTDQGVAVGYESVSIDLVEHLCAAIGGLGVGADLRVDVFGPEIPLLDGGALRLCNALNQLDLPILEDRPRITKPATLVFDTSTYRFTPSIQTRLIVHVDFDHPLVRVKRAEWGGSPTDFFERIASARTFGFRRDGERLRAAGRSRSVDMRSVIVLEDDGTSESCPAPDECARHKLLDLVGDLTLAGGIPYGVIEAKRPGHRATHAVVSQARAQGVLE